MATHKPFSLAATLLSYMAITTLCLQGCGPKNPTDILAKDAKGFMDFNTLMIIVDMREPDEFCGEGGHLPNARNYPWKSGVLKQRFRELPPHAPIIVVCRNGRRSQTAAQFLRDNGYSRALNLAGGMKAWKWETESCQDANEPPSTP